MSRVCEAEGMIGIDDVVHYARSVRKYWLALLSEEIERHHEVYRLYYSRLNNNPPGGE